MTRSRTHARILALAALSIAGCSSNGPKGGTDVGNGATVSINLQAYEDADAGPRSLALADGGRIDELWMVVDRIRLRPGDTCSGGDTAIDIRGPLVADLVGDGLIGGPASFPIVPGPFCRFHLGFQKLDPQAVPTGAPADLANLSILVKGARSDGVLFSVEADFGEEFDVDAKSGSFALPAGPSPLLVAFDLASWMTALDLESLSGSPIVVSPDVNKDRLDALDTAVQTSEHLFHDENGDGKLSPDEETAANQLTQ
jgi:hypothetical protein